MMNSAITIANQFDVLANDEPMSPSKPLSTPSTSKRKADDRMSAAQTASPSKSKRLAIDSSRSAETATSSTSEREAPRIPSAAKTAASSALRAASATPATTKRKASDAPNPARSVCKSPSQETVLVDEPEYEVEADSSSRASSRSSALGCDLCEEPKVRDRKRPWDFCTHKVCELCRAQLLQVSQSYGLRAMCPLCTKAPEGAPPGKIEVLAPHVRARVVKSIREAVTLQRAAAHAARADRERAPAPDTPSRAERAAKRNAREVHDSQPTSPVATSPPKKAKGKRAAASSPREAMIASAGSAASGSKPETASLPLRPSPSSRLPLPSAPLSGCTPAAACSNAAATASKTSSAPSSKVAAALGSTPPSAPVHEPQTTVDDSQDLTQTENSPCEATEAKLGIPAVPPNPHPSHEANAASTPSDSKSSAAVTTTDSPVAERDPATDSDLFARSGGLKSKLRMLLPSCTRRRAL